MTKHKHEFPHSTSIQCCEYDEATKDMHITFVSGGKHCFKNVDADDFHAFKDHPSPGTHFHSKIRRAYKSEKVE
jgi:hypothetical protein